MVLFVWVCLFIFYFFIWINLVRSTWLMTFTSGFRVRPCGGLTVGFLLVHSSAAYGWAPPFPRCLPVGRHWNWLSRWPFWVMHSGGVFSEEHRAELPVGEKRRKQEFDCVGLSISASLSKLLECAWFPTYSSAVDWGEHLKSALAWIFTFLTLALRLSHILTHQDKLLLPLNQLTPETRLFPCRFCAMTLNTSVSLYPK